MARLVALRTCFRAWCNSLRPASWKAFGLRGMARGAVRAWRGPVWRTRVWCVVCCRRRVLWRRLGAERTGVGSTGAGRLRARLRLRRWLSCVRLRCRVPSDWHCRRSLRRRLRLSGPVLPGRSIRRSFARLVCRSVIRRCLSCRMRWLATRLRMSCGDRVCAIR